MRHVAASLPVIAVVLTLVSYPDERSRSMMADHEVREQVRLRAHFDSVLDELSDGPRVVLSPSQLAARGQLITWLREYRDAGSFPLNDRYADTLTPVFRDTRGVTCAMAYLIERSGRGDIVDRIAGGRNLAYIQELRDDTALVAWLDGVGLGIEEAARVQPAYGPPPGSEPKDDYPMWSVAASGTSLIFTGFNVVRPRTGIGAVGAFIGTVVLLSGTTKLASDEYDPTPDRNWAKLNVGTGAAAVLTGVYAMLRSTSKRPPTVGAKVRTGGLSVTPVVETAMDGKAFRVGVAGVF